MNNTKEHQKLVDDLLFAFGSRPDVRLFPRQVALACPVIGFKEGKPVCSERPIHFGIKGEADCQGTIYIKKFGIGISLACEVKTGAGKLTLEQEKWKTMFLKFGGIYIEVRSVEQALQALEAVVKSFQ